MAQPPKYRIPLASRLKLGVTEPESLQVNFCKNTRCENFGIPAKEEPVKPGPNPDRDPHYKATNTAKGRVPAILCKSCKEKIPIKSNTGISAEFERIARPALTTTEKLACKTTTCPNLGKSVAVHPERYNKAGFHSITAEQLYLCKACKKRLLASDPVRIHQKTRHLASNLFSRAVNKSPVRGSIRGMIDGEISLASASNYLSTFKSTNSTGPTSTIDAMPPSQRFVPSIRTAAISWE
ncbi:MAG: hypothetical protein JAZ19_13815 [Candidatus Thiodiazotropha taylori]|nr:hypothetical protein [Candidatus Thiodiazotropha taylori]